MIQYTEGYKYRLYADASLTLPEAFQPHSFSSEWGKLLNGTLTIYKGYAWDGASGPTIDGKCNMQGALGHDALYQAMREGSLQRSLKDDADRYLQSQCKEDGMPAWRAWLWYRAVKNFGLSATLRNKDILVAP